MAAAAADPGRQQCRTVATLIILLHNTVRTDELLQADVADLGMDRGHRVLTVTRKGARRTHRPLIPATWAALENYLARPPAWRTGRGWPGC